MAWCSNLLGSRITSTIKEKAKTKPEIWIGLLIIFIGILDYQRFNMITLFYAGILGLMSVFLANYFTA